MMLLVATVGLYAWAWILAWRYGHIPEQWGSQPGYNHGPWHGRFTNPAHESGELVSLAFMTTLAGLLFAFIDALVLETRRGYLLGVAWILMIVVAIEHAWLVD